MTNQFFNILLLFAMLGTVAALIFGLYAFFKGGDYNKKWGNKAMQYRVYFQAAALIILCGLMFYGIK